MHTDDTIAAIGTAPGEAGIAVVRLSGPDALSIADRVFRGPGPLPSARQGGTFVHGYTHEGGVDVDEVLLLIMRAPASYTREDMVEIQGHGGGQPARRNLRLVLEAGARLAEPGEFTKRAFLNGRLDLLQAEAVLDLIRARSDRAATAALEQLEGALSSRFNTLYDETLAIAADLEATLDFPEEELPPSVLEGITARLAAVQARFSELVETWDEGRLLREGARVVISGRPNVGKSTLMNVLLGVERTIVTDIPGTTRDAIEEGFVLEGMPLRLVDTAGLRQTSDAIESEGIRRARAHLEHADAHLYLIDASSPLEREDRANLETVLPEDCLVVLNKVDLGEEIDASELAPFRVVRTSLLPGGSGVPELLRELARLLRAKVNLSIEPRAAISERHRRIIMEADHALREALNLLNENREEVLALAASTLRTGLESLGTATGRTYQEELLSSIFSRFCIGK